MNQICPCSSENLQNAIAFDAIAFDGIMSDILILHKFVSPLIHCLPNELQPCYFNNWDVEYDRIFTSTSETTKIVTPFQLIKFDIFTHSKHLLSKLQIKHQ